MDVAGQACSKQNYIFLPGSENSKWLTLGAATSADESNTILRAVRLAASKYTRRRTKCFSRSEAERCESGCNRSNLMAAVRPPGP